MKLPKEWEAIVTNNGDIRTVAEKLFALTQKPRKELTDMDIENLRIKCLGEQVGFFARAIEAAVWAKQREPETVTFRAARHKADNRVSMLEVIDNANIARCWEWIEPPQTFEVKL